MTRDQIYAVDPSATREDLMGRSPSISEAIGTALQEIEAKARQNRQRDDYYAQWSADAVQARPVIMMGTVLEGQTYVWLMDAEADAAMVCEVNHLRDATGENVDLVRAGVESNVGFLLHTLRQHVSWLIKEQTGEHLAEMAPAQRVIEPAVVQGAA